MSRWFWEVPAFAGMTGFVGQALLLPRRDFVGAELCAGGLWFGAFGAKPVALDLFGSSRL